MARGARRRSVAARPGSRPLGAARSPIRAPIHSPALAPALALVLALALATTAAACGGAVSVAPAPTSLPDTVPPDTVPATTVPPDTVPVTTLPATTATPPATATTPPATATTLPDPASLPRSGTGEFVVATADDHPFEIEGSPMIEFSVAVEDGAGVDVDELATLVVATLSSRRSWVGRGAGFRLVDEGGRFTLVVATPDTVDELCLPLRTLGEVSCARNGWIALNLLRWETATDDWPADLLTYRRYLINHEVGHYILGPGHESCPGEGELAPIMMQQTKGLDGCEANGWVDP